MKRRLDTTTMLIIFGAVFLVLLLISGAYIGAGVVLKADLPIVRNLVVPLQLPAASSDAVLIADTWSPLHTYKPIEYVPYFSAEETEDGFFERMSDVDRRSLYQLTRTFPELVEGGWSYLYFDALDTVVSPLLSEERNAQLRDALLAGTVVTKQGDPIYAIDGLHSLLLVSTVINETPGYMAITYDKTKLALSVTNKAHEGRWSTVGEHLEQNNGSIVAIPANNYTYNARMGYGVVAGGFYDNNIPRYKMSDNIALYMGFKRDGTFSVGEGARFGMDNFSEGQGILLSQGEVPEHVTVPDWEQTQVLEHLASFIAASGVDTESENFDSIPLIKKFLESFDDFMLQARYAWIIKENTQENAKDSDALIKLCDELGADTYATTVIPVRSAFTAIGQRHADGATVLFGIGGAKKYDVRELPGNGATFDELQNLFLAYGITDAAVTTSGDRVGFGWKGQSLLHIQDTTDEGGHTYGAYLLK